MVVHASQSPFAQRMMDKPSPFAATADPAFRIFDDPPEQVQIAFGGRAWFWETGCRATYRIGLFKGLGWALDPMLVMSSEAKDPRINHVKVTGPNKKQECNMEFLHHTGADHSNDATLRGEFEHVEFRDAVPLDQLKSVYTEVLGVIFS